MRKKKQIKRFANWFFGEFNLPKIKIRYINAIALRMPTGVFCFGGYVYGIENDKKYNEIYISYNLPKNELMEVITHELIHYLQDYNSGLKTYKTEDAEKEAENLIPVILQRWEKRISRKKGRKQGKEQYG